MVNSRLEVDAQCKVLRCLAKEVINAKQLVETVNDLIENPCLLHSYVETTSINWRRIANEVGIDERKASHWYRETHLRHILTVKMTSEDRTEIRKIIINWIRCQQVPDKRLYQVIYERFGAQYSRQELRMTYNNILNSRCIRGVLSECNIQRPIKHRKHNRTVHTIPHPAVSHIPGYTSNSQPASLDCKRSSSSYSRRVLSTNSDVSSKSSTETNTELENTLSDVVQDEFNPFVGHPMVQTNEQNQQCGKLLYIQAIPLYFNDSSQLAIVPLVIVNPETNVGPIIFANNMVGEMHQ